MERKGTKQRRGRKEDDNYEGKRKIESLGPRFGLSNKNSDRGDSSLVVNWLNLRWKINNQKFRAEVQKTQNLLDRTDFLPMGDHPDVFQHMYSDWNQKADHLTHEAREKGPVGLFLR